jgi:hypothetical protein
MSRRQKYELRTEPLGIASPSFDRAAVEAALRDGHQPEPDWPAESQPAIPARGGGAGTVLWAIFLAPVGLILGLIHWGQHRATKCDAWAIAIGGLLTGISVVSIIVTAVSGPPMPANGGFTNMSVLQPSITQTMNHHNSALGLPQTVKNTKCVLDYGSTYTCVLNEVSGGAPVQIPITVDVTGNGTEWKSS